MNSSAVYCPKCGTQGIEGARFCKRCGTNLEAVSRALTGQLVGGTADDLSTEMEIAYAKEYSRAVYALLGSIGVFLALLFIFKGAFWVYFLLLWIANNVRDVVQASLLKRQITNPAAFQAALGAYKDEKRKKRRRKRGAEAEQLAAPPEPVALDSGPVHGDYVPPARTTGELARPQEFSFDPENPPPSVTEGTTRLLEEDEPAPSGEPRLAPRSAVRNGSD